MIWFGRVVRGRGGNVTQHDQPFGFLHAVGIRLRVAQAFPFGVLGLFDLVFGAVADEDGFAAPFDDYLFLWFPPLALGNRFLEGVWKEVGEGAAYVLALWDSLEVDFNFGLRQHVG